MYTDDFVRKKNLLVGIYKLYVNTLKSFLTSKESFLDGKYKLSQIRYMYLYISQQTEVPY